MADPCRSHMPGCWLFFSVLIASTWANGWPHWSILSWFFCSFILFLNLSVILTPLCILLLDAGLGDNIRRSSFGRTPRSFPVSKVVGVYDYPDFFCFRAFWIDSFWDFSPTKRLYSYIWSLGNVIAGAVYFFHSSKKVSHQNWYCWSPDRAPMQLTSLKLTFIFTFCFARWALSWQWRLLLWKGSELSQSCFHFFGNALGPDWHRRKEIRRSWGYAHFAIQMTSQLEISFPT